MIADLGWSTILLALIVAVYAAISALYGGLVKQEKWIESGRRATLIIFPLILIASVLLVSAMLRGDFYIEYVWRVTSLDMPTYLKVTALWGGQAGSLLFWNLILAGFTMGAMLRDWRHQRELMPYVIFMAALTQIFFLGISVFVENPFTKVIDPTTGLVFMPPDGNGLNPLLRHPGMIIHPPMLYLGFTGFTIPYTFAMAALFAGKLDEDWIRITRKWTLVAWLFLSLGLILGGRWAYDVLGWGGYWAWDPVENASFMPWLAGTAFLHSVMIQEKRGMFKVWNMFLVILTYLLVVYGTFIVRSGVISSVHSFARSAIGPLFFGFLALMLILSTVLVVVRLPQLSSKNKVESFLSRETAFLVNNFLFLGILFITFFLTNFPILSELFTGEKSMVGETVYEQATAPLFAALVLLMGIAPLTMWYRTSLKRLEKGLRWPAVGATVILFAAVLFTGMKSIGAMIGLWIVIFSGVLTLIEFWKGVQARMKRGEGAGIAFMRLLARNRRRYGGYWIHLGVVVMSFGIIGTEFFQQQTQLRLLRGESAELGDYRVEFKGVSRFDGPDDLLITEASLDLFYKGEYVKSLHPRTELYTRTNQPMTIPDLRSTISEDFYMLMVNWEGTSNDAATFRLYINPLINWVWAGGIIFIFGTMIGMWPDRDEKRKVTGGLFSFLRVQLPEQV